MNAVIAVLVLRNIITEDEGQRLVDFLHDKPQSTVLKDSIAAVAEVIGKPTTSVLPPLGPVGPAQIAETLAAHAPAPTVAPSVEPETITEGTGTAGEIKTEGGETYTPETDKTAKDSSVKKSTDKAAKK